MQMPMTKSRFVDIRRAATRRAALAAIASAVAAPAVLAAPMRKGETLIAALWRDVGALDRQLVPHAADIDAATKARGVPGWMVLTGDAYRLGEERYGKLVAIMNAKPADARDLAIMAKVSLDADMADGPRGWAGLRLAQAALAAGSLAA
jgi:hypothetical protein